MNYSQIENILLIIILVLNLVILYNIINRKQELFSTLEKDNEHYNRYTGYTLTPDQFSTYQPPAVYEKVCR